MFCKVFRMVCLPPVRTGLEELNPNALKQKHQIKKPLILTANRQTQSGQ